MTDEARADGPSGEGAPFAAPQGPAMATQSQAPGWYPDPWNPASQRYWDGTQWTAQQFSGTPESAGSTRAGRSRNAKIGIAAGIVLGVGVLIAGAVLLLPRLGDAVTSALNGDPDARTLDASVPTDWNQLSIMGDTATVSYDPAWEDVSEVVGIDDLESILQEDAEFDIAMHGAWLMSGDLVNGGPSIVIVSAEDVGGQSSARIEAQSFMTGIRMDIEGVTTSSEGAIRTSEGYTGYVIEYDAPLYGETWPNAVGVVVEGSSQLLVYSNGDLTSGSGLDSVEAVLESLRFN